MTHVRTQIRDTVRTLLETVLPAYNVHSNRRFAVNLSELPMIDMQILNENISREAMGDGQIRVASLYLRVTEVGSDSSMDDMLDEVSVTIEHAIAGSVELENLAFNVELMQTNFTEGTVGDNSTGEVILRYDVTYRVDAYDVEQAKG